MCQIQILVGFRPRFFFVVKLLLCTFNLFFFAKWIFDLCKMDVCFRAGVWLPGGTLLGLKNLLFFWSRFVISAK